MDFIPVLVLSATVKKVVDLARQGADNRVRDIIITLVAWLAGFLVVLLTAHTPWANGIEVAGTHLADIGLPGAALLGIGIGSTASVAHDAITRTNG